MIMNQNSKSGYFKIPQKLSWKPYLPINEAIQLTSQWFKQKEVENYHHKSLKIK